MMRVGVIAERGSGETRVALAPESVRKLLALGAPKKGEASAEPKVAAVVESGAGAKAFFSDEEYGAAGATIVGPDEPWDADVVACVGPPDAARVRRMRRGAVLIGMLKPTQSADLVRALADAGVTALAFEVVPRITRAQSVDALSSMSTIAGYRAAILGAEACPKMFPLLMTAAGTVNAARALVLGCGVAGLQAIATCKRLGAVVEAYDIRAAAKEQAQSLGARFVELPEDAAAKDAETAGGYAKEQSEERQRRQRELLADHVANADVVITTALVPGRPAPRLVDAATVARMRPGAVVVDLAAEAGGNCELARAGERVVSGGVTVLGPLNLPAQAPAHASLMFSRNVAAFVQLLAPKGELTVNMGDEVVRGSAVTHGGEVVNDGVRAALGLPARAEEAAA